MAARIIAGLIAVAAVFGIAVVAFGGAADTPVDGSLAATSGNEPDSMASEAASTDSAPADTVPAEATPTATPAPAGPPPQIENLGPRMDLVEIDGWLNTDATSIDEFNGQVLLVEMWTFGCSNCKARIPYNQSYYDEFSDENFEIIGVHAPEFSHEAEVPNIIDAVDRLGVTWPVALDTDKKNFRSWQPGTTNFWPRTMVIDQNGDIRYDHIGEGKYEELREAIRWLLDNPPPTSAAAAS